MMVFSSTSSYMLTLDPTMERAVHLVPRSEPTTDAFKQATVVVADPKRLVIGRNFV